MMKPLRGHTTEPKPAAKSAGKPKRYLETELQIALVARMRRAGQAPMFVENEARRTPAQAARWERMGGARGGPDLLLPLRRVAIECKSPTGTVKRHQEAWHEALRDNGWLVYVARSESDVPSWVLDGEEEPNEATRERHGLWRCERCQVDNGRRDEECRGCGLVPGGYWICRCGWSNGNHLDECSRCERAAADKRT